MKDKIYLFEEYNSLNEGMLDNIKKMFNKYLDRLKTKIKINFTDEEWLQLLKINKSGTNIPSNIKEKLEEYAENNQSYFEKLLSTSINEAFEEKEIKKKPKSLRISRIIMGLIALFIVWKIYYGGFHADIYFDNGKVIKHAKVNASTHRKYCIEADGKTYHSDEVELKNIRW